MTDINQQQLPPTQAAQEQTNTPDVAQNTDTAGQTQSIPYDRFKQVNDAKKAAEDKLKQYEDAERKRAEEEALKRGDFENVINGLKPKAERADALEEALKGYLEAELTEVPANMRDLLPTGDITAQLAWIKQAKSKGLFNRVPAPNTDAGATGDPKPQTKLTDEQRTLARQFGMTDDEYAKHIWDGKRSF